VDTVDGYRIWSKTYDQQIDGLFSDEVSVVHEILDALPPGIALDAACGTGRHAELLAAKGHRVIGVDSSPDMLDHARKRVPQADFRRGDLHQLPLPDDHVDIVVCALALTHLPDLKPPIAEFARVLRPGGHLVIFDMHHELVALGSVPRVRSESGEPGILTGYRHRAGDYLNAALPLGLQVRRCHEAIPAGGGTGTKGMPEDIVTGPWDSWPWSLMEIVPDAVAAAWAGTPSTVIWDFELSVPVLPGA
jgi:SAM-dependent methyltransferase